MEAEEEGGVTGLGAAGGVGGVGAVGAVVGRGDGCRRGYESAQCILQEAGEAVHAVENPHQRLGLGGVGVGVGVCQNHSLEPGPAEFTHQRTADIALLQSEEPCADVVA